MPRLSTLIGLAVLAVLLTAGAAQSLSGSNTVFTDDLAPGAVNFSDIHANAVTSSRIADGAIFGKDIAANSVTGADVNEGTIPGFKKVFFSRVSSLGTQIGGSATSVTRPQTGFYNVTFPFPIGQCASTATVASFSDNPPGNIFQPGNFATVDALSSPPNTAQVVVSTHVGAPTNLSFALVVVCA